MFEYSYQTVLFVLTLVYIFVICPALIFFSIRDILKEDFDVHRRNILIIMIALTGAAGAAIYFFLLKKQYHKRYVAFFALFLISILFYVSFAILGYQFLVTPESQFLLYPEVIYQEHEYEYKLDIEAEDLVGINSLEDDYSISWIYTESDIFSEGRAIMTSRIKDRIYTDLPLSDGLYFIKIFFLSNASVTEMYLNFDGSFNQIYLEREANVTDNVSVSEHYVYLSGNSTAMHVFIDEPTVVTLDKFEIYKSKFDFEKFPPEERFIFECSKTEDCEVFGTHCCGCLGTYLSVNRRFLPALIRERGSCEGVRCPYCEVSHPDAEPSCNNKICQLVYTKKYRKV